MMIIIPCSAEKVRSSDLLDLAYALTVNKSQERE